MAENSRASAWRGERPGLRMFVVLFLVGFLVRGTVLFSGVLPESMMRPFGEIGKVAVSLARTGEYANPYKIPTGSTAHTTPVYAGLLGLLYLLLGTGASSGYVRGLAAIITYSTLYAALPWLSWRLGFGVRAGVVGGLAGAVIPLQFLLEVIGGSDVCFASVAMAALIAAFVARWTAERRSAAGSWLFGIGCGVAFHCCPPLLFVVVGGLLFELGWFRDRGKWLHVSCVVLGAALACVPWAYRNYRAFDTLLFVRGNFGLELRLANHDGAHPDIDVTVAREPDLRHPSVSLAEAKLVRDLGEAEYMRRSREEALDWIKRHPREFLRLTVMRAGYFWFGPPREPLLLAGLSGLTILALLGLWHSIGALTIPQRAAVLIPLALFPLVYYVVSYVGHYRGPMEWLLLLMAGAEVQRWLPGGKANRNSA